MSTASQDPSADQPQRTSHQSGPLAILAATAIGGVIGTRLGKAPWLLAAGAAALALMKQKKPASSPAVQQGQPPPAPQLEIPVHSQVEQWLSRQISREEQAPVVDFSMAELAPGETEDDYHPESFLLDDFDEGLRAAPLDNDSFAGLTEPALPPASQAPETKLDLEKTQAEPLLEEPVAALPLPPQVLHLTPPPSASPVAGDAAWTLGVDPMPSLNEPAPYVAPAGSLFFSTPVRPAAAVSEPDPPPSHMFSTAPVRQEDLGPPLFFSNSVFQGAVFPDEIQVAPAIEPAPLMPPPPPAAVQEPKPVNEPLPSAETSPEIPVELAAPGDASFDPPLAAAPPNPWQPEPDVFAMTHAAPVQTQMTSTVVEAEVILRPRAPVQSAVIAKSKFAPPGFGKHFPDVSSDAPPVEDAEDAHFPGPLQSQHDPKPRPTWRSWWRGD